jgi:hypothetical protein
MAIWMVMGPAARHLTRTIWQSEQVIPAPLLRPSQVMPEFHSQII